MANANAAAAAATATTTLYQVWSSAREPTSRANRQTWRDRQNIEDLYRTGAAAPTGTIEAILQIHIEDATRRRSEKEIKVLPVGLCDQIMTELRGSRDLVDQMLPREFGNAYSTMQCGIGAADRYATLPRPDNERPLLFIFVWFDLETPVSIPVREKIHIPAVLGGCESWFHGNGTTSSSHFGLSINSTVARAEADIDYIFNGPYTAECFTGIHFYGRQWTFGWRDWKQLLPSHRVGAGTFMCGAAADIVLAHPAHWILAPCVVGGVTTLVPSACWRGYKLVRVCQWTAQEDIRHLFSRAGRRE